MTGFALHDNDGVVVATVLYFDDALRLSRRRIWLGLPYEYITSVATGGVCAVRPNQRKRGARFTDFAITSVPSLLN